MLQSRQTERNPRRRSSRALRFSSSIPLLSAIYRHCPPKHPGTILKLYRLYRTSLKHRPIVLLPTASNDEYHLQTMSTIFCTFLIDDLRWPQLTQRPVCRIHLRRIEERQILQIHSLRGQWKKTHVQRINGSRASLRKISFFILLRTKSVEPKVRTILSEEDIPVSLAHL